MAAFSAMVVHERHAPFAARKPWHSEETLFCSGNSWTKKGGTSWYLILIYSNIDIISSYIIREHNTIILISYYNIDILWYSYSNILSTSSEIPSSVSQFSNCSFGPKASCDGILFPDLSCDEGRIDQHKVKRPMELLETVSPHESVLIYRYHLVI